VSAMWYATFAGIEDQKYLLDFWMKLSDATLMKQLPEAVCEVNSETGKRMMCVDWASAVDQHTCSQFRPSLSTDKDLAKHQQWLLTSFDDIGR
jgi:hypothetical protein